MATAQPKVADAQQATSVSAEQHEDPKVALKKEWEEAVRKTRPRDAAQGMKSGIATAAAGVASGVVGLFAAPIVGAKQDGAAGFAKGLATGEQMPCASYWSRLVHAALFMVGAGRMRYTTVFDHEQMSNVSIAETD